MGEMCLLDEHLLMKFPPRLRKNIKEIYINGKIGISSRNIQVHVNSTKSGIDVYSPTYKDYFILEIPYAGKQLCWEVYFKEEDFGFPPDFDFHDSFLFDPDVDVISNHIPSLAKWDIDNPKSLISVIRELMELYKKHQVARLQTDNKYCSLYAEYEHLIAEVDDGENNIEVYIDNGGAVHFLICISVNFSELPPYLQPILLGKADSVLNPNEDIAILRIALKPDSSKVQSDLQLSPRLEQVIGSASTLHIPLFNRDTNNILDYISQITTLLEERVEFICNNYKLKNEYISFIISACGSNIIEYDSTAFSKAILLCEVNDFYSLVFIQIGNKFPQEKPKVALRSIYNLQNDRPFIQNLDNYPYSPRWTPEEMVKRLLINLREEISNFQATCQRLASS